MHKLDRTTAYTSQPMNRAATTWSGFAPAAKTSAALLPLLGVLASAQTASAGDALATGAASQMGGVITLIVAILVIGIGLSVLWFANKNTKKGVSKAG